jgi:DoxX
MAGAVFFWEGLLKFAYANQGVGRFTKLGMPMPEVLAPTIAVLEIGGGLLLMSGRGTRLISVPFVIEMLVAILSTKISLYLGTSPLPAPPAPPVMGGVGRAARDSLRVRPNHDLYLSARRRSRALVARCTAPSAAPSQRRGGLERRLPQLGPQG